MVGASIVGVEVCARMQLALSAVGCLLGVYRTLYAKRRQAKKEENSTTAGATNPKNGVLSVAAQDELSHLLFTMSYPSQCRMQSLDRLQKPWSTRIVGNNRTANRCRGTLMRNIIYPRSNLFF